MNNNKMKNEVVEYLVKPVKTPDGREGYAASMVKAGMADNAHIIKLLVKRNALLSPGCMRGIITDYTDIIAELLVKGYTVRLGDIALIKAEIKSKAMAGDTSPEHVASNIEGLRLGIRGMGPLKLAATRQNMDFVPERDGSKSLQNGDG